MKLEFVAALPTEEDAKLVLSWRNDPVTLSGSFHGRPKEWSSFLNEFKNEYFLYPQFPPLFISLAGEKCGLIRLRPASVGVADISIMIAPEFRARGIAKEALLAIKPWIRTRGVDKVIAEIKRENQPSLELFKKAGFISEGEQEKIVDVTGQVCKIVRFYLELHADKKQKPVFIIAEAGSNWVDTDPYQMIEAAKEAGADAIKFQVFRGEQTYAPSAGHSDYLSFQGIKEDIHALFKKLEMPYELIPKLAKHAEKCGIEFMSSVFSPENFQAVDPYVKRHKLASYEVPYLELIALMAKTKKPLLMSTGASTLLEIAWAVETFFAADGEDLTLLQCTACYPAPLNSMNLKTIKTLKQLFHVPTGLSDHSLDPLLAPIAAVALGATVIEKHFTLDKSLKGPDHTFSLVPSELKELVFAVRSTEEMLGSGEKVIHPVEEELFHYAKRRVQAIHAIAKNESVKLGVNSAVLRTGKNRPGAHPKFIDQLEGKKLKRNIALGEGISLDDVE